MRDPVGALYDEIAYPSIPFPQTHPDRLATMAGLYGLQAAPVERCRVLELGCGDGSNLIPMALGLPSAQFVGVDLATDPIARGQETIRALGLDNVVLRVQDLRDLAGADAEPFDYVIAHGVYSWVPPDTREAVLTVMRRLLAPHGVAFLSYNSYPGGHVRQMVREMLLYHTAGSERGEIAIARAQGLARVLADAMPVTDELSSVRACLRAAASRHPGTLFHDELSPDNQAFYFHEVVEQAGAHGLRYLAEADFSDMQDRAFKPEVQAILSSIEQERGRIAREQYLDFLKGRMFRQTLLCHADVPLGAEPTAADLRRYLVAGPVQPASAQPDLRPQVVEQFHGPRQLSVQIDHPLVRAALVELGAAWPDRLAFDDLVGRAKQRLGRMAPAALVDADAVDAVANVLFAIFGMGLVQLHTWKPRLATRPSVRPKLSPLARLQVERAESPAIATLLHDVVFVGEPVGLETLRLLDGTRDRAAFAVTLRRWLRERQHDATVPLSAQPDDITPAAVDAKLLELARLGLFIA